MLWKEDVVPSEEDFEAVEAACNACCIEAVESMLNEAFNPGDLHCTDVYWCHARDGKAFWLCEVEEAAPDAHKLRLFIRDRMAMRNYEVEVSLSW